MVADAVEGDRLIGMVLLKSGWERDYEGTPPVYPIGCSGVITHFDRLPDGRYNIVLRGLERFRILREDHAKRYRRAVVEALRDQTPDASDRATVQRLRAKLEAMLAPAVERSGTDTRIPIGMGDEDLVNALAQYLDLEPLEKQALLEERGLRRRAESLVDLLEMKMLVPRLPKLPTLAH
jgi:Lon protease-like protein